MAPQANRGFMSTTIISRRAFVAGAALSACAFATGCAGQRANEESTTASAEEPEPNAAAPQSADEPEGAASVARPTRCGRLSVEGGQLVDASGNPVQLKGFSTHGLAWFPQYVNAECFAEIAGWGANVARLALYTDEVGGWCTDGDKDELRAVVDKGVQCAQDADMYVIVDWHVLHDQNPNAHLTEAKAFWEETSRRYAAREHVIYEICNEPNGSTTWEDVKSYADVVIPIIRKNDPRAPILVGTPTWSQDIDRAAAAPIEGFDNVMYTLHFYAATHKDDLRLRLRNAVESGLPVFVSEYGICDASGNGAIDVESARAWMALLDELGISSACWNLSNKAESSSIIASSCSKTSGFDDGDLSTCGVWLRSMLQGLEASGAETLPSVSAGTPVVSGYTPAVSASAGVTCAISLRQSWEANGKPVNLYDLVISADGQTSASNWSVDLAFDSAVRVTDSWNATVSQEGRTLHLSPASYNATIAAGATLSDVGLIVEMG